jgi:hypothetical protein
MGGTSGLAVLAHYDYDAQGRLESILRGNGVRTGHELRRRLPP